ncbi:PREDICTED: secretin receptor, partial [Elephantulus edwardii]|uniref:secretin receptor n=1 Tax=Elephantulus edwardii TaxID=28737 RepID=UPI0003F064F1
MPAAHVVSAGPHYHMAGVKVGALPRLCDVLQVLWAERDQCLQDLSKNQTEDLDVEQPTPGCEKLWDNMSCWPSTSLGQTVQVECPRFLQMLTDRNGSMFRNCTRSGWSGAFPRPDIACGIDINSLFNEKQHRFLLKLKVLYTVGYSSSLVTLLVALSILCAFRRLHCTRNYIHMHLFLSFILRALSNFIKDAVLFSDDATHCDAHRVTCSPAIFVTLWAITRHFLEDDGCWDINVNASVWWVIRGPVILSILVASLSTVFKLPFRPGPRLSEITRASSPRKSRVPFRPSVRFSEFPNSSFHWKSRTPLRNASPLLIRSGSLVHRFQDSLPPRSMLVRVPKGFFPPENPGTFEKRLSASYL